jgi:sugar/nucleoside kinase (ribokinase family)
VTRFDILAIGNALVDVLSHEGEAFITRSGVERGVMTMVDAARSDEIYAQMSATIEMSGGSAANTAAGIASFGGNAAYVGRIANDTFGKIFAHDLRSLGVHFDSPIADDGSSTGRCLVIVTDDAQRTMYTHLGAANRLDTDAIEESVVADASITYLEGYLWDEPEAKDAIRRAARFAHAAGRRVALTLSDPFCVDRHREEFRQLVDDEVDILFANEHEITMLYEVDHFDDALQQVRGHVDVAALTRGASGSVIVGGNEVHVVSAHHVGDVVDTTGAGDLYAAGFLFGLGHGYDLPTCGRLGSLAAGEVISHLGARPGTALRELAAPLLAG